MKIPKANPEGYEKTSDVERAHDLSGHLLLVYGTYDDNELRAGLQTEGFSDCLWNHHLALG